jgi:transcriptional regulator with XRE-family HTH domain
VARALGADETSVTNWEKNRAEPSLRFLPSITEFLGYAPWTNQGCVADRLLAYRRERGLSQGKFADLLGVDPGTLSRWERGSRIPTDRLASRVTAMIVEY